MRRILVRMGHTVPAPARGGRDCWSPRRTGTTFAENAAHQGPGHLRGVPEQPTIADDSGLCVDALDGAPGVYSARYCGRARRRRAPTTDKLLAALAGRAGERRRARRGSPAAVCVWLPRRAPCAVFVGRCARCRVGFVTQRGTNGFGYDPLLHPGRGGHAGPGRGRAAANAARRTPMPSFRPQEKDAISHRGRAHGADGSGSCARFLADGSVIGMTCGNARITVADKAEG